jgi:hypothetical protein
MSYAFKPSAIDELLVRIEEEMPELLIPVLEAIREESDRLARGAYTKEESDMLKMVKDAAESCANEIDGIMLDVIK